MERTPLVSVITPVHNAEQFIENTIQSVLEQSYSNLEMVLVNDASVDNSLAILEKYAAADSRIKVCNLDENGGAAIARNKGIDICSGEFVCFIDSDDTWQQEKISQQLMFMYEHKLQFSFTAYEVMTETGEKTSIVDMNSKSEVSYSDMLAKRATVGCSTVMLKRSLIGEHRMPLIRTGQDYAFWLKLLKTGVSAKCLRVPLTNYRIVKNSISRNKVKKAQRQWEIYTQIEKLGLFKSAYYFVNYAYRAIIRK